MNHACFKMLLFLLYFTEESFWASQRTFRAMSQQTLEEEEEDESGQAIQIQKGMPSSRLEGQHLASFANVSFDIVFIRLSLCRNPSDPSGQSLSWLL